MRQWLTRMARRHLFNMIAATAITLLLLQEATRAITQDREVVIHARFVASSDRMQVAPADVFPVSCRVAGTAVRLAAFQSALPEVVDLVVGSDDVPGTAGAWPVADRMGDFLATRLHATDITFVSASAPASAATLTIADLVEYTPEITVLPGEGVRAATIDGQGTMTLFVPADIAQRRPQLQVRVSALDRKPGPYQDELMPSLEGLAPSRTAEVRGLKPVRVSYSIVSTTRELTLPRVGVQVAALPDSLAKYRVELPTSSQFIRDVVVAGPTDAIAALESNEARPLAIVHLMHEDLVNRVTAAQVDFWMLPEGVRVLSTSGRTGSTPTVEVEISQQPVAGLPPATTPVSPPTVP